MRRGAITYEAGDTDAAPVALVDAPNGAAYLAGAAIDAAPDFIVASNESIAGREAEASRRAARKAA